MCVVHKTYDYGCLCYYVRRLCVHQAISLLSKLIELEPANERNFYKVAYRSVHGNYYTVVLLTWSVALLRVK